MGSLAVISNGGTRVCEGYYMNRICNNCSDIHKCDTRVRVPVSRSLVGYSALTHVPSRNVTLWVHTKQGQEAMYGLTPDSYRIVSYDKDKDVWKDYIKGYTLNPRYITWFREIIPDFDIFQRSGY